MEVEMILNYVTWEGVRKQRAIDIGVETQQDKLMREITGTKIQPVGCVNGSAIY